MRRIFALCLLTAPLLCCGRQEPPAAAVSASQPPLKLTNLQVRRIPSQHGQGTYALHSEIACDPPEIIVGLAWRLEPVTYTDGTKETPESEWRPGDASELRWYDNSLAVTRFAIHQFENFLETQAPAPKMKLRLRAALAKRTVLIKIPKFQLDHEYKISENGYSLVARGTRTESDIGAGGVTVGCGMFRFPRDVDAAWQGLPEMSWRVGFLKPDGTLATPNGYHGGFSFGYIKLKDETFAVEFPADVRLVEQIIEVAVPISAAETSVVSH